MSRPRSATSGPPQMKEEEDNLPGAVVSNQEGTGSANSAVPSLVGRVTVDALRQFRERTAATDSQPVDGNISGGNSTTGELENTLVNQSSGDAVSGEMDAILVEPGGEHGEHDERVEGDHPAGNQSRPALPHQFLNADTNASLGEMDDVEAEVELDDDGDVLVLDPDHPLMRRFQARVADQLSRQEEKLELERLEKAKSLKEIQTRREDIGVELYSLQQQLARQQTELEMQMEQHAALGQQRKVCETELSHIKRLYSAQAEELKKFRSRADQVRSKLDAVSSEVHHIEVASENLQSEQLVADRLKQRADEDVNSAEHAKLQQDLYANWLDERLDRVQKKIDTLLMQKKAQSQDTEAAKDLLAEAVTDMEALKIHQREVLSRWNAALLGMRRRDEALAAVEKALRDEKQQQIEVNAELSGYRRNIMAEQERHEQLMAQRSRLSNEVTMATNQLELSRRKQEKLNQEYQEYSRSLHHVEEQLGLNTTNCNIKRQELDALRQQTERVVLERQACEDAIHEKYMAQTTLEHATGNAKKALDKLHKEAKRLETTVIQVENDTSRKVLDLERTQGEVDQLLKEQERMNKLMDERNTLISRCEAEIHRRNVIIERKQTQIDQMNKKIDQIRNSQNGEEEVGPLEVMIHNLHKQIDASKDECQQMEQLWLRHQHDIVEKTKDVHCCTNDIENFKRELTILQQRKIRVEGEINRERKERGTIEQDTRQMQLDMTRISTLINEKRGRQQYLEQDSVLRENDFVAALKEAELASCRLQNDVQDVKEEKEHLLHNLVEAERHIMLWEKKIQLAKDTKAMVDSDSMQGEIRRMKEEVHRMTVRYQQLMRQQENKIQEMEKAVLRRDVLNIKVDGQTKTGKLLKTRGHCKQKIAELRRKVQQTLQNAAACDQEVIQLREDGRQTEEQVSQKQATCEDAHKALATLQQSRAEQEAAKQKAFHKLLWLQSQNKHFTAVKEGRYIQLCKGEQNIEAELERQRSRTKNLHAVLDELERHFPQHGDAIRRVAQPIVWRTEALPHLLATPS